jgi:hypothetical protein
MTAYPALQAATRELYEAAKHQQYTKAVAKIRKKLEKGMKAAFQKQKKIFLGKFTGLRSYFAEASQSNVPWDTIFAAMTEATREQILEEISDAAAKGLTLGGVQAIKDLGIDLKFDLKNTKAVAFMDQYGLDYVKGIDETTRDGLRDLMTESISEGWSYTDTAKAIAEMFDKFSDWRARLIAITETGHAYSEGTLITAQIMQEAGLQMQKSWLTAGDDDVEEDCRENEEAEWIDIDDEFPSGDDRPLAHPNCRCVLLTRRAGSGDDEEEEG